eukprot:m.54360 g.54360  ORF g.54360 m.54360 type:complete len:361 (-) comp7522_c0_seq2:177-1259(-)
MSVSPEPMTDPAGRANRNTGCKTCGKRFSLITHRKRTCQRCDAPTCGRCLKKSPRKVTRRNPLVKKAMCSHCNAIVIVPFLTRADLAVAPRQQLVRYLNHHTANQTRSSMMPRECLERAVYALLDPSRLPADVMGVEHTSPRRPANEAGAPDDPRASVARPRIRYLGRREFERRVTARESLLAQPSTPPRGPTPAGITNLLLAEQLLGRLLIAIDGGASNAQQSDEEHRQRQSELREKHKREMERQRIAAKLHTAKSEDEFREMRVADLKVILEVNHVDHATVIEKDVLVAMVIDLWRSTQAIESKASTERTCKICFDAPSDCVFLECGHLVTCVTCGSQLEECPMCRSAIVRAIRVYET